MRIVLSWDSHSPFMNLLHTENTRWILLMKNADKRTLCEGLRKLAGLLFFAQRTETFIAMFLFVCSIFLSPSQSKKREITLYCLVYVCMINTSCFLL
jgi:hypothetical protein